MHSKNIRALISMLLTAVMLLGLVPFAAAAESEYVYCDLDGSGQADANDARAALRFSVDLDYYTKGHLALCGIEESFSASDARFILRLAVGLEQAQTAFVRVNDEAFSQYVNKPSDDGLFEWIIPEAPEVKAESGTFTFTVYGYGHGVGLSQYGAMSLEDGGYTYDRILSHYYSGTVIGQIEEFPEFTLYPTLTYSEELGYETYIKTEQPTEELLARIVYQEIYGVTKLGRYKESLKALTLCIFTNLMSYDFDVDSRWDVGVASALSYEELPENLRSLVKEVLGQYITVKGDTAPILAVFSGLAAGMTASSEDIWGGYLSYLTAVPSPFDMQREGFITTYTYTVEEMREKITAYDSTIVLADDPAQWLEIVSHTASMDEDRGYVTKIRVGDKVLRGYNQFHMGLMGNLHRSSCFTITYTP